MKRIFIFLSVIAAVSATAELVKIVLPPETSVYKNATGVVFAKAQCLTCHSADYCAIQPPKARDFWKAEVDKMKSKYGAPIPDEQIETLVSYFAENYGTEAATNSVPQNSGEK